jgi:hypothetical protein
MLSNGAGTEKLRFEYDGDPVQITPVDGLGARWYPTFADCSITEAIGDDLTLVSVDDGVFTGIAVVESAAGGQFFQEMLVTLGYTPQT